MDFRRRDLIAGLLAIAAGPALAQPRPPRRPPISFDPDLAAIERRHGGRLGVFALDTGSRKTLNWRPDERFTMCSTFKGLLAAQVLARVDAGQESLSRRLSYGAGELLGVSPVTTKHVDEGALSIDTLARAMVETSDNTAAVLLMRTTGGPEGLTRFLRTIGDDATRSDRWEPDCNLYDPLLDTTTPRAVTMTARRILLGNVLKPQSRQLLESWMIAATPGMNRLRAAFPRHWIAGDKTGTSTSRQTNDYAIVRPPGRRPLVVAAYYDAPRVSADEREQALREVGAIFVKWAS